MAKPETLLLVVHKQTVEHLPETRNWFVSYFLGEGGVSGIFCVTSRRLAFLKSGFGKMPYPATISELDQFLESHGGWSATRSNIASIRVNHRGAKGRPVIGTSWIAMIGGVLSKFDETQVSELIVETRQPSETAIFRFSGGQTADLVRRTLQDGPNKVPQLPSSDT